VEQANSEKKASTHRSNLDDAGAQYWLAMDGWNAEETSYLLCGQDPRYQTGLARTGGRRVILMSSFIPPDDDLYALISRAFDAGTLASPASPKSVFEWAKAKALKLPALLLSAGDSNSKSTAQISNAIGTDKVENIDWHFWRNMPEVKQWQACALSLNINPDEMKRHRESWMAGADKDSFFTQNSFPSDTAKGDFEKRLRLLRSNLSNAQYFNIADIEYWPVQHLEVKLSEFSRWCKGIGLDIPVELSEMAALPVIMNVQNTSPWLKADPRDPHPQLAWYTPARYFARQLVKDDSTLLTKKEVLASKVVTSLSGVGIKKRGGKKDFDSATIKKAFAGVNLG
jgi:hypothetical protein